MKPFYLKRLVDVSETSGTGIVAIGVLFKSTGKCVLHWETKTSSIAVYDSLSHLRKIHGHNGKTKIIMGKPK